MLTELFDATGEFNAARLVWLTPFGWVIVSAVLVLALAVTYLGWRNTQGLGLKRRIGLLGLRASAVAALVLLFLQPAVRLENVTRVRNHLILLVDDSRSMTLPGEGEQTRLAGVKAWLESQQAALSALSQTHQFDLYAFSDRARPIADESALQGQGESTRLLTALEELSTRFEPADLAGVVVVSDGADNGALAEYRGGEPNGLKAAAARLGAPVHTVFSGPERAPPDIAIARVIHDDFAFVRNVVSIEAEVTVSGYTDLTLPVTLRRGEVVLGTRQLITRAGEQTYRFEFEFVPDRIGKGVFTLEVASAPGETIKVNNRRDFVMRIIRDRIRVLQVVGRPSWDERFLRTLLKKNPNIDLISFFILRTGASIDLAGRDELSLIPFPTQELFEVQLGSFDLVIFQNFTFKGYSMRHYLPLVRDYVRDGGGFVMVGGDQSFTGGGYADTPVAEFLPVNLPPEGEPAEVDGRFQPRLTEAGLRHPITALSRIPEENRKLWAGLPALSGVNRVTGLAPDSTVLLTHPTELAGGQPAPVMALRTFGEGRVMAITTDTTWHWDFLAASEGDNRHYYKLWGNAIRWLIRDPALDAVQLEADRDTYPLDAEAQLLIRVHDRDFAPAANTAVRLTLERAVMGPDGALSQEVALVEEAKTDERGEASLRVRPPREGPYTARVVADLPGGAGSAEEVFVVSPDPVELRETAPKPELLKALAQAGGGEALALDDDIDGLTLNEPRVVKVNRRQDIPLWASAWWLLVVLALPSLEWFLRRRYGLL